MSLDAAIVDWDVWVPGTEELKRSRILGFASSVGCDSVQQLVSRSNDDPAWFWGAVADWLELDWQTLPRATVDNLDSGHEAKWFPQGALNIADNAVDRWIRRGRGAETALRWETDEGLLREWSFVELSAVVDRFGNALLESGVRFGDRVGLQTPMVPEAVVALLAVAKIGAVAVPIFSGFGAQAVADRLRFAGARTHVVSASFVRRGRLIDLRADLAGQLPLVEGLITTIVLDHPEALPGPGLPGEIAWGEFLAGASASPLDAAVCPSDHPLLVAFTSGTTGQPKGVVLSHAGFAVKAGSDAAFSFDVGPSDVSAWVTDPGWIMSPIVTLGGLVAGSAVALFAGAPDHPDSGRLWEFVRRADVSMLGLSPTLVRLLMDRTLVSGTDVGRLRVVASSGEPWTADAYLWLFAEVLGRRVPIINYSGGTEVSGAILSNTTAQPIHPCGFAGPLPGMGALVVNDSGSALVNGVGELALRHASPGMPITFWEDPERYVATYWQRWPGMWHHGDFAESTPEGVWFIHGRSDDTLKIAGKRVGPAEIENAVNSVEGVVESAAVGVPDAIKGTAVVVFATCPGGTATADDIRAAIERRFGKPLSPKEIHLVGPLPKTRSGKILRRVIQSAYLGGPLGDLSSLEDRRSLDTIRAVGRGTPDDVE